MQTLILTPDNSPPSSLAKVSPQSGLILGTTTGLVKATNEDRLGCITGSATTRLCIADGHWGDKAAESIIKHWISEDMVFPYTRDAAIDAVRQDEDTLHAAFGRPNMDPEHDFTPEAGFIAAELSGATLSVVSYGDCRLFVARNGTIIFQNVLDATWLGAFSRLGLRQRVPVDIATRFERVTVQQNDLLFLFTDGVDECVYETPTLAWSFMAGLAALKNPEDIFDAILAEVFANGAEDNASLAILKVQ
jgi:serine/threonine protein phosphatase PrpC